MIISSSEAVPLSQARENLPRLTYQIGAEHVIPQDEESHAAIIHAQRLDDHCQLARERIRLLVLEDASKGLADVQAGKVKDARDTLTLLKHQGTTKVVAACVPG